MKVIGIGIDAPRFSGGTVAEDFILLLCETWPDETRTYHEELNMEWNFFGTPALRQFNDRLTQFVPPPKIEERIRQLAREGLGKGKIARTLGIGVSVAQRVLA